MPRWLPGTDEAVGATVLDGVCSGLEARWCSPDWRPGWTVTRWRWRRCGWPARSWWRWRRRRWPGWARPTRRAFVPDSAPSGRADPLLRREFPDDPTRDPAVIVLARRGGLTDADRAHVGSLASFLVSPVARPRRQHHSEPPRAGLSSSSWQAWRSAAGDHQDSRLPRIVVAAEISNQPARVTEMSRRRRPL